MTDISILAEMVAKAEADLRAADSDAEVAKAEVERATAAYGAARQHQANMRATLEWLRIQHRDHSMLPATVPEVTHLRPAKPGRTLFGKPAPRVSQADLCLQALEELGRPATTTEVRDKLAAGGHQYETAQVRSALKYLTRKKDAPAESIKPGVWRLNPRDRAFTFEPNTAPVANGHREAAMR